MENTRPRLASLRKAGTDRPATLRTSAPQLPLRGTPPLSRLAAPVVEEVEDYVSPLAAPAVRTPAPKPTVPRSALTLPEMKVKPKTNAPKKRGRPVGTKNAKRRGDGGLILTDRDKQRLYALMVHGWITRSHLAFLCGEAPTTAEPRIRELVKAGYIAARHVEGRKYLYLSTKGYKAVEETIMLADEKYREVPFYLAQRTTRPSAHDLKIVTVCAALRLGDEDFYALSNREVDFLNRNKEAHNLRVQKQNSVLHTQQRAIITKGGAGNEAEQAVLDAKPKSYQTTVFDYQTPKEFAPGIIAGPKHVITEAQINAAHKSAKQKRVEQLKTQYQENLGRELTDEDLKNFKSTYREEDLVPELWGRTIERYMENSSRMVDGLLSYPIREEGDLSPLHPKELQQIRKTLGNSQKAWIFDHLNRSHMSRNPHLLTRGTFSKTHRPDGVIVLPHILGRDGLVRSGCVAIEVEEHVKTAKQTVENMATLFDHPLYDRAIYYVPGDAGVHNIRKRFDAVERELKHGYILDDHYPLREAIERFFIIVRMDEDYYLSYRSSPTGEWG